MAEQDEQGPVDLEQVRADEELLRALAAAEPVADPDAVTTLLAAWRADVHARPLPTDDDALVTAALAARPARRGRFLVPVTAAAAAAVVALAGAGVATREARPGDALWGVSQVVFAEQARSVEAAGTVETDLGVAERALAEGRLADADAALARAGAQLPAVAGPQGAAELRERYDSLTRARAGVAPAPSPSPTSTPAGPAPSTVPSRSTAPSAVPPVVVEPGPTDEPGPVSTTPAVPPTTSAPAPSTTTPAPSTTVEPSPSGSTTPTPAATPQLVPGTSAAPAT